MHSLRAEFHLQPEMLSQALTLDELKPDETVLLRLVAWEPAVDVNVVTIAKTAPIIIAATTIRTMYWSARPSIPFILKLYSMDL